MPALALANTNQIAATAGYAPRLNLGEALQLQVPQLYADRSFAQQTRSADLAQEAEATRQSQQKGANIVQGGGTVGQLGLAAVSNWDKLKAGYNGIFGPSTPADVGVTGSALSATPASVGAAEAVGASGEGALFGATSAVPATTAEAAGAYTSGAVADAALAGGSSAAAGSGLLAAAAPVAGGAVAGGASGLLSAYTSSKLPISRGAQRGIGAAGGAAAGAGLGFLIGGPIGAIGGGLLGGLSGGSVCPIHSAAYGDHSVEVTIARRFRDCYLTRGQLRAYYSGYEDVAAHMTRDPAYRMHMRRTLIDPLIRVGANLMAMPYAPVQPGDMDITRRFLHELHQRGATLGPVKRQNGEVV